ncbi:MAG: DUF1294 domain-containing protein [Lachnospiraceae bacterium]|nr:DUF1294 domain-containing protein [Lachnospiraceae bacterium]
MNLNQIFLIVYIAFLAIMSLITAALFAADKKKAEKGAMRTKEKVLLGFVCFGGALGGLISSRLVRHKTNKAYFTFTICLSLICNIAVIVILTLLSIGG